MMTPQVSGSQMLYVSHVEPHGPFIKVWGQVEKQVALHIEKALKDLSPRFDVGQGSPSLQEIKPGLLCCAKYNDGNYYRAQIRNISSIMQYNMVEVQFLDYGNRDMVSTAGLRITDAFLPGFLSIPPQAREFILANVTHQGQTWDFNVLGTVMKIIRYRELQYVVVSQIDQCILVKLYLNGEDVAQSLFHQGTVLSIATIAQQIQLQQLMQGQLQAAPISPKTPMQVVQQQVQPQETAPLPSFKSVTLEPGSQHSVYVAYVSDGPLLFSVQLVKIESTLHRLMQSLSLMPLKPLDVDPIPGTVCVARCKEDDHICRAVVSSMTDNQFKVYYVDFGNSEVVPFTSLYSIPPEFVIPKVMAMRYALAGLDRCNVTIEMKVAFKRYVQDRPLLMKVHQLPEGRSYIPLCDLFGEDGVSALDVVIAAATTSYPQPLQLSRGFTQEVTVNYVQTCSRFFVQLAAKADKLNAVMEELQNSCPSATPLQLSELKPGLPCCALFQTDGQWYRAEILSIEGQSIQVRYVDYGNEETVDVSDLRRPVAEQITCLFPQALECCLNGYQNMPDDEQRDILFDELTLEKTFAMKIVEMLGNKALVELIDSNKASVASALLSKIAAANAAANPVVVPETFSRPAPTNTYFENRNKPKFQDSKPWGGANNNDDGDQNNWRQKKPRSQRENNFESGGFRSDNRIKSYKQQQNNNWGGNKSRRKRSEDGEWGESSATDRMEQKRNNKFSKDGFNRNQNRRNNAEIRHENENWGDESKYESKSKFGRSGGFRKDGGSDGDWKKDRGGDGDWKKSRASDGDWKDRGSEGDSRRDRGGDGDWKKGRGGDGDWKKDRGGDDRKRFNRDNNDGGRERRRDFNRTDSAPWKSSTLPVKQVANPAPSDAQFGVLELTDQCVRVTISWFHNPGSFYCQLIDTKKQLDEMMNDIADSYEGIEPGTAEEGGPAIALFSEDQSIYRVRVLGVVGLQYRVQFVDFGNIALTDKVWPIESRFMELPAQSVHCALSLIPAGEAWGDTDGYFGDKEFVCQFISKQPEDNTYTIGLWYDDKNIAESLVADGLARYSDGYDSLPVLESNMLIAQQIWVTLGEVAALDNFIVTLGGHNLVCAMHNLLEATETKEEVLKAVVGTTVIMYVDNVLDDKLEVTLYDNTGTKLEIINPDEGSYPTVDPLCPFPVTSSTISGYVSHVTETTLFLQPSECADAIEQLLEKIFNQYNGSVVEAPVEPVVGSTYAALAPDTNWYRAQVTEVGGETVTVLYVDYGNSEEVAVGNLRELTGEFLAMHVLALEVTVANIDKTLLDQIVTATVWYGDAGWEATLQLPTETAAAETAVTTETAAVTEATAAEVSQPAEPTEPQTDTTYQQPLENCVNTDTTTSPVGVSVVLTHTDSPTEFYVQWSEELDAINNLHALLQEQVPEFPDLENPTAGMICVAPYSVDQEWYRAQILDADADITTVRFIDYGNTDVVDNASTKVKTLPPELLAIEPHACRCSLKVQCTDGSGGEWSSDSISRFEELTSDVDALAVEILHKDEKTTYVNLHAAGCNVGETLVSENLAGALELETQSSCTGYICNINSPSEFWIQLENSVADLEWIAEQLSDAHKFADLDDLTPGSLCAALFPEDQMWYRARILSNTVAGLEVLFIDYGNSCTCSGLKQLPEELIMLTALAQKCTLLKPHGILQWSSQANKKFNEIAEDGACVFSINRLGTGETSVVQLFRNGADISMELAPETVPVKISHFESIDKFWLQKLEDLSKLDELAGKMGGASDWSDCSADHHDKLVGAMFDEGSVFCRASVLETRGVGEYDVLFVDYGNSATSRVIKELPDDLGDLPAFACKCKLEPVLGYSWSAHASQEFEALQSENFTAEFEPDGVVILYINQVDVRSRLSSISASPFNSPKKTKSLSKEPSQAREVDEIATVVTTEQQEILTLTNNTGLTQNETDSECESKQVAIAEQEETSKEETSKEETSKEEIEVSNQEVFEAPSQIVTNSDEQEKSSKSEILTTEIPERITGTSEVKVDNQISSPTKDKAIIESEIDNFKSGENEVVDNQLVEEECEGKHLEDKIEDIETTIAQEEAADEATTQEVPEIEEKENETKKKDATEVNTKPVDQEDDEVEKHAGNN